MHAQNCVHLPWVLKVDHLGHMLEVVIGGALFVIFLVYIASRLAPARSLSIGGPFRLISDTVFRGCLSRDQADVFIFMCPRFSKTRRRQH